MNGPGLGQTTSLCPNSEDHLCSFPQIEILEEDGDLKKGMKVLSPCPECGETPLDHIEFSERRQKELQDALLAVEPFRPLYHWSPVARRKQINRYGLRPHMRPAVSVVEGYKAPYVCFADSPSWAWALSGAMNWPPKGEWDLWMVYLDRLTDPIVHATPDRKSGLYEVRTEHRVFKRDIWYVGHRTKE